tara:strand:+ start:5860 stop:6195 length:336 start_codon:yes stop_codon:yes gene_type:complete
MGATTFYETSRGKTAEEAFFAAQKEARYMHGHGGYTGTIAEKHSFTIASSEPLSREKAYALANSLRDTEYSNKWGPAGCIRLDSPARQIGWNQDKNKPSSFEFLFFGWASE